MLSMGPSKPFILKRMGTKMMEKFDQRFLRTNHVREKEAALRGGYNIVTGRIGQTPPPRPTAVDPTAAGGARKNGNGSKYFFRNLNSTFDRFS